VKWQLGMMNRNRVGARRPLMEVCGSRAIYKRGRGSKTTGPRCLSSTSEFAAPRAVPSYFCRTSSKVSTLSLPFSRQVHC
jgi:hypothetical protein